VAVAWWQLRPSLPTFFASPTSGSAGVVPSPPDVAPEVGAAASAETEVVHKFPSAIEAFNHRRQLNARVLLVKAFQRQGDESAEKWRAYCDSLGENAGEYKPHKHSIDVLTTFLKQNDVRIPEVDSSLCNGVERLIGTNRAAWKLYCRKTQDGTRNPALLSDEAIKSFFDDLETWRAQVPAPEKKPSGGKPKKEALTKQRSGHVKAGSPPIYLKGAISNARIKLRHYIGADDANFATWNKYCELLGLRSGRVDYAEEAVVRAFLDKQGIEVPAESEEDIKIRMKLSGKVRRFQKGGPEFLKAWTDFADTIRTDAIYDPRLFSIMDLATFLEQHEGMVAEAVDPMKQQALDRWKELMQADKDNQKAWRAFVKKGKSNYKDPAFHSTEELLLFFSELEPEHAMA